MFETAFFGMDLVPVGLLQVAIVGVVGNSLARSVGQFHGQQVGAQGHSIYMVKLIFNICCLGDRHGREGEMTGRVVLAVRSNSRIFAVIAEGSELLTDSLGDGLELLPSMRLNVLSFLLVFDDFLLYPCPRKLLYLPLRLFIFCMVLHK